jgi:starvation-inducible DNA-binding protein
MKTGMTEEGRKKIADGLKVFLANTYALYLGTQNAHWNYEGPHFYSLHILFEKQYEELAEAVDEIAERIRALGFFAPASFASFQELSMIQGKKNLPSEEMAKDLIHGHEKLLCHARDLCDLAEKERDGGSTDLLGRRLGVHEKFIWMLKSYS